MGACLGRIFGFRDVYAARLDAANGNVLWSTQIGTPGFESVRAITADTILGKVYIAGETSGSFGGPAVGGGSDAFLISINAVPGVPEPSTMMLLIFAVAGSCLPRGRNVSSTR